MHPTTRSCNSVNKQRIEKWISEQQAAVHSSDIQSNHKQPPPPSPPPVESSTTRCGDVVVLSPPRRKFRLQVLVDRVIEKLPLHTHTVQQHKLSLLDFRPEPFLSEEISSRLGVSTVGWRGTEAGDRSWRRDDSLPIPTRVREKLLERRVIFYEWNCD